MFFKVAQKVKSYLGNLGEKLCQLNLSKIAQSGHTVYSVTSVYTN